MGHHRHSIYNLFVNDTVIVAFPNKISMLKL
uniref:Uncharacterized protein n=1 Tax=Setaria italica TaxID=4555 RepID=K3XTL2_SETIT